MILKEGLLLFVGGPLNDQIRPWNGRERWSHPSVATLEPLNSDMYLPKPSVSLIYYWLREIWMPLRLRYPYFNGKECVSFMLLEGFTIDNLLDSFESNRIVIIYILVWIYKNKKKNWKSDRKNFKLSEEILMNTENIIEGLRILQKYRQYKDGSDVDAGPQIIYASRTTGCLFNADIERMVELGWFQGDDDDDNAENGFVAELYKRDKTWKIFTN